MIKTEKNPKFLHLSEPKHEQNTKWYNIIHILQQTNVIFLSNTCFIFLTVVGVQSK